MISGGDRAYLPRQERAASGVKAGGPREDIADARLTLQTRSRGWYLKKSTRAFGIVFYPREETDNFRGEQSDVSLISRVSESSFYRN